MFLLGCFGMLWGGWGGGVCGNVRVHLLSMLMHVDAALRTYVLTFNNLHVHLLSMWMLREEHLWGWGWGGGAVLINVRVHLLSMLMLRPERLCSRLCAPAFDVDAA